MGAIKNIFLLEGRDPKRPHSGRFSASYSLLQALTGDTGPLSVSHAVYPWLRRARPMVTDPARNETTRPSVFSWQRRLGGLHTGVIARLHLRVRRRIAVS